MAWPSSFMGACDEVAGGVGFYGSVPVGGIAVADRFCGRWSASA
jgi:hypothetical protein